MMPRWLSSSSFSCCISSHFFSSSRSSFFRSPSFASNRTFSRSYASLPLSVRTRCSRSSSSTRWINWSVSFLRLGRLQKRYVFSSFVSASSARRDWIVSSASSPVMGDCGCGGPMSPSSVSITVSFPLPWFPLSWFPLPWFPLSWFPLSWFPLPSFPLPSFSLPSFSLPSPPLSPSSFS